MNKAFAFLVAAIIFLGGAYFILQSQWAPSVQEGTSAEDARMLVENFGRELQNVSLLAQRQQLERDMQNAYGRYVAPDLLAEWLNNPQQAPGRLTSSQWPERIDIQSVEQIGEGPMYYIQGEIVEVTNEGEGIGEAPTETLRRPITLTVELLVEGLRITEVVLGAAASDGEWIYTEPNAQGIQFQYPRTLPTRYISAPTEGWPPRVALEGGRDFSCAPEGTRMVGDRQYCVTVSSEGAAGSTYRTYEYTTAQGDFLARVEFTLQFPQCANYGEDEQPVCEAEQASFDIDGLVDRIASSIRML
ncbi:MAG TPA: hypothetical protein VNM40_00815 [Candidatus Paceibacterota bacterium]|nr:hypothetical protein [Candidatus Paceibacterota bacterium]